MTTLREGELEFQFSGCKGEKFDAEGHSFPIGMSLVDFVVDEPSGRRLLVEVKDPSSSPPEHRPDYFVDNNTTNNLINSRLVPPCRDSWTILYLQARDVESNFFIAFIGTDAIPTEDALIQIASERLKQRLMKEMDEPWRRPYVTGGILVNERVWRRHFPQYTLSRIQEP
jgi:hypothetical protein